MNEKIRKVSLKRKVIIAIVLLFSVCIGLKCFIYFIGKNKHINLNELNTKSYVQAADNASKGKLQVNWQYLAAIDGVRYENDFSKGTSDSVNELANMFVEKNSTDYKVKNNKYSLVDLDVVLGNLSFDKKQKERVYNYIEDLKYIGITKKNLNDVSTQQFIQELYPEAIKIYDQYGVFPSVTIAQAILETGWGKSELSTKANNLFGIKADSSWKGKKVKMNTSEYYKQKIVDEFRAYDNKQESIKDYGEFLNNNKRYKQSGVFQATYYIDQARAIEKAGYSTVENDKGKQIYSDLLIDIIQEQNLQLLDSQQEMKYSKGTVSNIK